MKKVDKSKEERPSSFLKEGEEICGDKKINMEEKDTGTMKRNDNKVKTFSFELWGKFMKKKERELEEITDDLDEDKQELKKKKRQMLNSIKRYSRHWSKEEMKRNKEEREQQKKEKKEKERGREEVSKGEVEMREVVENPCEEEEVVPYCTEFIKESKRPLGETSDELDDILPTKEEQEEQEEQLLVRERWATKRENNTNNEEAKTQYRVWKRFELGPYQIIVMKREYRK